MSLGRRANVASSFTLVKGALIDETYAVLAAWDFSLTKKENLDRLRRENFIGAKSTKWVREVARVLNRRLDPEGRDRPLTMLAQSGCDIEAWKPLLLWHMTRDELLLRDFLSSWLFPAFVSGVYRVRAEELDDFLAALSTREGAVEHAWSPTTTARVASALLRIAADFGLLRGGAVKEFASYHLPEQSFVYLLHAMREEHVSPARVVGAQDWRMFLMRPADVERELLRLHQFKKLEYEVAGSLVQLSLPCASPAEYAKRMVA